MGRHITALLKSVSGGGWRLAGLVGAGMVALAAGLALMSASMAFAQPKTPERKTGIELYFYYCSTCHGRSGEGLTNEFRATWPEREQNCWQSKCHAPNHPPEGFILPKYVPALIGPGTLARFPTAPSLFAFIRARMPYQQPGKLTDEQYWVVTAFLLQSNGIDTGDEPLNATNAADILVAVPATTEEFLQAMPTPPRTPTPAASPER